MKAPFVSVIIPVYNVQMYLDECVNSVLGSSLKDIEVLLVDDGSTDGSSEKCRLWSAKDNRVRYYRKRNGGLSDARNYGIKNARGEYISFVDSDDKISANMLEEMYCACKRYDCMIGICDVVLWSPNDSMKQEVRVGDLPESEFITDFNYKDFAEMYHNTAWRKLYHRSLFLHDVKFPKGIFHEDIGLWWVMMAQVDSLAIINKPLYYYRQDNAASICNQADSYRRANDTILSLAYGFHHGKNLISRRKRLMYTDDFLKVYLKTAYPNLVSHKATRAHKALMCSLRKVAEQSDPETRDTFFSQFSMIVTNPPVLRVGLLCDLLKMNTGFSINLFGVKFLQVHIARRRSCDTGG